MEILGESAGSWLGSVNHEDKKKKQSSKKGIDEGRWYLTQNVNFDGVS